jgi:uncharacterized membrane protein YgcG
MKTYALTALSVAAVIGLVIATPMLSRAAGFGAATGVSKSLAPSVNLASGCAASNETPHMLWLACNSGPTPGGGNSSSSSSSSSGSSGTSGTSSSGTSGGGGGPGGHTHPGMGY